MLSFAFSVLGTISTHVTAQDVSADYQVARRRHILYTRQSKKKTGNLSHVRRRMKQ
jgi:hypothetical protein